MPVNEYGQMVGEPVDDTPGVLPSLVRIEGQYTIIEALSVEKHTEDLLAVYGPDSPREMWTYLFQPPVANLEELMVALKQMLERKDRFYYAIIDKDWPKVKARFEAWLKSENFDEEGHQLKSLREC